MTTIANVDANIRASAPPAQSPAAVASTASFAAAMRDLERSADMMLAMPVVRSPGGGTAVRDERSPALRQGESEADRSPPQTESESSALRAGRGATDAERSATDARSAQEASPVVTAPLAGEGSPRPSAWERLGLHAGRAGGRQHNPEPSPRAAAVDIAPTDARSAGENVAMLPVQSSIREPTTALAAPVDEAAPGSPARRPLPAVGTTGDPSPSATFVVAHVAGDHASIGVRAGRLTDSSKQELIERLRAECGAHGISTYSLQLNGATVVWSPRSGGGSPWR